MDVIVKGQPSIEVRMEAKVVDSYKTADAALSESSVNPVQNKVVTAELGKKATKAELSALETKVTENKTATDTAVSDLSAKVDEEVESVQTQLDSHDILIEDLQENKADTTGYYPQLSVGQADNLPDRGDVNEGLLGFRESAGAGNSIEDGTANVQELLGESLVWNQLRSDDAFNASELSGVSLSLDGQYVVLNGTTTADVSFAVTKKSSVIKGHKYLIVGGKIEGATYNFYDTNLIGTTGVNNTIFTALESGVVFAQRIYCPNGRTFNNYRLVPRLHDLTLMFGAGKEPSTIEEFEARTSQLVGVDFNAYNEGEVLGVNIKGIKSVNDNAWDEEWEIGAYSSTTGDPVTASNYIRSKNKIKILPNTEYIYIAPTTYSSYARLVFYDEGGKFISYIGSSSVLNKPFKTPTNAAYMAFWTGDSLSTPTYNHDICIRLAHSGYKTDYVAHEESESSFDLTKYFPNGMHGINGVRDSVTKSKATRRFEVVKMKGLSWNYATTNRYFYTIGIESMALAANAPIAILCNRYSPVIWSDFIANYTGNRNKMIAKTDTNKKARINILDDNFTSVESFVASLTDEDILIYELATPIETEIEPQLNMNYKVWDFGTEELLTDSKSAPVLARTIYGFNATDTIRGNKAKNEEQDVRLGEIERTMVQKEDYAPALTSGFADNLVGSDVIVDKDFTIRKSGDGAILDGAARMEVVKGNSVVWNQLVNLTPKTITSNGVTATIGDDGLVTISGQNNGEANSVLELMSTTRIKAFRYGHKMLHVASGVPQGAGWGKYGLYLTQLNEEPDSLIANGNYKFFTVAGTTDSFTTSYVYTIWKGVEHTDCSFKSRLIDLTQMFGAGNEPTTIEEFYARKPIVEDEYTYNEGEVIHCNVDAVKSVGRNVWDEEWELGQINVLSGVDEPSINAIRSKNFCDCLPNETYYAYCAGYSNVYYLGIIWYDANYNYVGFNYTAGRTIRIPFNARYFKLTTNTSSQVSYGTTYNHDICINLSDPDFNGKYEPYKEDIKEIPTAIKEAFPEGMMSAGTAHDVAYNDLNKEVGVTEKRIGVVDLGIYKWYKDSSRDFFKVEAPIQIGTYYLCGKYTNILPSRLGIDRGINLVDSGKGTTHLRISDLSYTNENEFNASLQGVMLYYELAEPIVTEHDEPFKLDYQVANGGQEQAMANKETSAFNAKIAYGFNAAAKIKENANEIENLKAIITQLQAAIASMVNANVEDYE